jgi:hypothetical protein
MPQHFQHPEALMMPQILFQCYHCRVALKVPISFAGHTGPCPHCGQILLTPAPPYAPAPAAETPEPVKRHANPALTYATDAPSLMGRSLSAPATTPRSLNRGIMADQSISRSHEVKKENREARLMMLWILIVVLFLAAATYLMKSYVLGG